MSTKAIVYEVCNSCGVGKAACDGFDEDGKLYATPQSLVEFRQEHGEHRMDLVPEQVFLSAYLERGYKDVDRPNAKPIVTTIGGGAAPGGEKPMPYGAPQSAEDAARKAREQRRALQSKPSQSQFTGSMARSGFDGESYVEIPPRVEPPRVQMRPSWDETFLRVAEVLAQRGTCSRLKVGAVLVKDTRIISTGYNGAPAGLRHCDHRDGGDMENGHCSRAEHAERNALLLSRADARGATMYVTASPCLACARMAVTVGVNRIVYAAEYQPDPRVDELCAAAGIELAPLRLGS